jgi:hypothetical protein
VIATGSESSAHHRSYPVYPVVLRKRQSGHARPQTACRIEGCSGVIDIGKTDNEKHQTDANRRDKGVFRFLGSQHEDRQSKIGCQKLDVNLSAQRAVGATVVVYTISRNTPCATNVSGASLVCTISMSIGAMQLTTAAAQIAPSSCAGNKIKPRKGGSAPASTIPSVIAGLNRPPLTR